MILTELLFSIIGFLIGYGYARYRENTQTDRDLNKAIKNEYDKQLLRDEIKELELKIK